MRKFFAVLMGLCLLVGNAFAATCSNYYHNVSCNGITVASYNTYGDPTGAVNPSEVCYEAYNSITGEFSYYVKFYRFSSCNSSQGYESVPVQHQTTVCMESPDASAINFYYNTCTYVGSTWCSVSSVPVPTPPFTYVTSSVAPIINQKMAMYNCIEKQTIYLLKGDYAAEIQVCTRCMPSSTLEPSDNYDLSDLESIMGCKGLSGYYGCRYCGEACSSSWANVTGHDGYQARLAGDHPIGSCECETEYRCAANYYGAPNVSGTSYSGCTSCPLVCDIQSSSSAGTESVSGCCAPAGSTGSDVKGAFRLRTASCATED